MELAILRFNNILEEVLKKLLSVKLLDAVLLKDTLRGVFDDVINAFEKFISVVMRARVNLERELAAIRVKVDQDFEKQFIICIRWQNGHSVQDTQSQGVT